LGYSTPIDFVDSKPRQVSYWVNGEEFRIGNATTTIYPSAMAIDGHDVYVGGVEYVGNSKGVATYWKNGTAVKLSDGTKTEEIRGLTVVDGVVYAVGYETSVGDNTWKPKYWKNGSPVILPAKNFATIENVVVIGSDVHMIGFESSVDTVYARYWKNDKLIQIGEKTTYRFFADIVVEGNDFFIAGYDDLGSAKPMTDMKVRWWKNGVEAGTVSGSLPTRMTVSGGDVYMASQYACGYNKNNAYVEVKPFEIGKKFWSPSIAVSGSDVYLVTTSLGSDDILLGSYLLINGEAQAPFTGDDKKTALGVVIVK